MHALHRRGNPEILIVEDDQNMRMLVRAVFESVFRNAVFIELENSVKAMEHIAQRIPDLIVTDLIHPSGHGENFCRDVLLSSRTEKVPMIVISGAATSEVELRLYRLGVRAVFKKPFQIENLLRRVRVVFPWQGDIDSALLDVGTENASLDYKECLLLSGKKERASFAKDVIAMANAGGGQIIIGVAESPKGVFKRLGIGESSLPSFEVTKINDALQFYVGQSLSVECRTRQIEGRYFAFIKVPFVDHLAMAHAEHPDAALFKGRIYLRTDAARSEEIHDPILLQKMISQIAVRSLAKRAEMQEDRGLAAGGVPGPHDMVDL